jgi:hypothetical protein
VTIGANDYVNNYFLRGSPTKLEYTPAQYQELLLDKFSAQLAVNPSIIFTSDPVFLRLIRWHGSKTDLTSCNEA